MTDQPLTISSWPRAILHLDADAFFASCEQAIHPELRGVQRGMRLFEAKKACPDAVILPSDCEPYSLFSVRMLEIMIGFLRRGFTTSRSCSSTDPIFPGAGAHPKRSACYFFTPAGL